MMRTIDQERFEQLISELGHKLLNVIEQEYPAPERGPAEAAVILTTLHETYYSLVHAMAKQSDQIVELLALDKLSTDSAMLSRTIQLQFIDFCQKNRS